MRAILSFLLPALAAFAPDPVPMTRYHGTIRHAVVGTTECTPWDYPFKSRPKCANRVCTISCVVCTSDVTWGEYDPPNCLQDPPTCHADAPPGGAAAVDTPAVEEPKCEYKTREVTCTCPNSWPDGSPRYGTWTCSRKECGGQTVGREHCPTTCSTGCG